MTPIPQGFKQLETVSPFIRTNGPFYSKTEQQREVFGLLVAQQHCNRGNKLHGGMVCTIADIAIGHNIALSIWSERVRVKEEEHEQKPATPPASGPPGAPMATVSMSTDFSGSANLGDWVEVQVDVHRVGGSLAFANAYLVCQDQRIARVSAVFKLLRT
jgi:acyl-coenzyme A thioesterase 13